MILLYFFIGGWGERGTTKSTIPNFQQKCYPQPRSIIFLSFLTSVTCKCIWMYHGRTPLQWFNTNTYKHTTYIHTYTHLHKNTSESAGRDTTDLFQISNGLLLHPTLPINFMQIGELWKISIGITNALWSKGWHFWSGCFSWTKWVPKFSLLWMLWYFLL